MEIERQIEELFGIIENQEEKITTIQEIILYGHLHRYKGNKFNEYWDRYLIFKYGK